MRPVAAVGNNRWCLFPRRNQQRNWVFFNKDQFLTLAKLDEEQKTLVGAVLIPNKAIPRYDQEKDEKYIVFFTEDTIKQAQELFMSSLRNNNATYEHKVPVEGMTVVEFNHYVD